MESNERVSTGIAVVASSSQVLVPLFRRICAYWQPLTASLAAAGLFALSANPLALQSRLPHNHILDRLFYILDPLVLYLVTGFATFCLLATPAQIVWSEWRSRISLRSLLLQALGLFAAATLAAYGTSEILKIGLARARPIPVLEHP